FISILFRHPLTSTLFPYTTLFRSIDVVPDSSRRDDPFLSIEAGHAPNGKPVAPVNVGHGIGSPHDARQLGDVGNLDEAHVVDHRSEEHTSELQSRGHLVCRLLLEK